jgi:ethanolamine utilization microcompartment shell protein EutL
MQKLVIAAALCLVAGACSTRQQATGTAVGAATGALVAGPVGAVVGAGVGAVAAAPGGVVDQVEGAPRRRRTVRRR